MNPLSSVISSAPVEKPDEKLDLAKLFPPSSDGLDVHRLRCKDCACDFIEAPLNLVEPSPAITVSHYQHEVYDVGKLLPSNLCTEVERHESDDDQTSFHYVACADCDMIVGYVIFCTVDPKHLHTEDHIFLFKSLTIIKMHNRFLRASSVRQKYTESWIQ